jgi:hypothetical protein
MKSVKEVRLQVKQQHLTSDWQEVMWAVEIGLEVVIKIKSLFLLGLRAWTSRESGKAFNQAYIGKRLRAENPDYISPNLWMTL